MPPRISIITPWLDHPEFIADYEAAVIGADVEVIVVDNGSAAKNAAALSAMVSRLGGKYIRNEENRWFSAANNQGLAIAAGSIVLFLNNDINSQGPWLDAVRGDVELGSLYGPTLLHKSAGKVQFDYLEGWCIAAQRHVWDSLSGWNEADFPMPYCEDSELSVRAVRSGLRLVQTNWPVAHKGGGTAQTVPAVHRGADHNIGTLMAIVRGDVPSPLRRHRVHAGQLPSLGYYLQTGRLNDAERDYRRAVDLEPGRADLWIAYGAILRACGRFEAAVSAFQRAAQLDPGFQITAMKETAVALGTARRYVESIDILSQIVAQAPRSAGAHQDLASALARSGAYQQAIEAGRAAIALAPNLADAHATLADAHFNLGQLQQAIGSARIAVQLSPQNLLASYVLGRAQHRIGNFAEALAAFDRVVELIPNDAALLAERDDLRAKVMARHANFGG